MSLLTYSTETMALHNTLESLTLRCAYNVYELCVSEKLYGERVTQVVVLIKLELGLGFVVFFSLASPKPSWKAL